MADINQLVNRAEEFMVKAPYLPLGLAKEMIAALKEQVFAEDKWVDTNRVGFISTNIICELEETATPTPTPDPEDPDQPVTQDYA